MTYLGKAQKQGNEPRWVPSLWTEKVEETTGTANSSGGTLALTLPAASTAGLTYTYEVHVFQESADFYDAVVIAQNTDPTVVIEEERVTRDFDNPSYETSFSVSDGQVVVTVTNFSGSNQDFTIKVLRFTNGIEE